VFSVGASHDKVTDLSPLLTVCSSLPCGVDIEPSAEASGNKLPVEAVTGADAVGTAEVGAAPRETNEGVVAAEAVLALDAALAEDPVAEL
jgi:hypothetical protein